MLIPFFSQTDDAYRFYFTKIFWNKIIFIQTFLCITFAFLFSRLQTATFPNLQFLLTSDAPFWDNNFPLNILVADFERLYIYFFKLSERISLLEIYAGDQNNSTFLLIIIQIHYNNILFDSFNFVLSGHCLIPHPRWKRQRFRRGMGRAGRPRQACPTSGTSGGLEHHRQRLQAQLEGAARRRRHAHPRVRSRKVRSQTQTVDQGKNKNSISIKESL